MAQIITTMRMQHFLFRFVLASLIDSSSALFPSATRDAALEIYSSHRPLAPTFISIRSMDSPCSFTR